MRYRISYGLGWKLHHEFEANNHADAREIHKKWKEDNKKKYVSSSLSYYNAHTYSKITNATGGWWPVDNG